MSWKPRRCSVCGSRYQAREHSQSVYCRLCRMNAWAKNGKGGVALFERTMEAAATDQYLELACACESAPPWERQALRERMRRIAESAQ